MKDSPKSNPFVTNGNGADSAKQGRREDKREQEGGFHCTR